MESKRNGKQDMMKAKRTTKFPIAVIRSIFRERAERRAKLKNKPVMRTSKEGLLSLEKLLVSKFEYIADKTMDIVENSGLNTVSSKHVTFTAENIV